MTRALGLVGSQSLSRTIALDPNKKILKGKFTEVFLSRSVFLKVVDRKKIMGGGELGVGSLQVQLGLPS